MNKKEKKVVLYFPRPIDQLEHRIELPLSLMAIAAWPSDEGFKVVIIDERLEDDPLKLLLEEAENSVCVGISSMTGYQLVGALVAAKLIKKELPNIPVVWGGYHVSLKPEESIKDNNVDIIVKGQGEATFNELIKVLYNNEDISSVKGIFYKTEGEVKQTESRPLIDVNELPSMPYHLIDIEKIIEKNFKLTGIKKRVIEYYSSIGCPFNCSYCADATVYKRRWMGIDAQRVVNEIKNLKEKYNIDQINFIDANFFANEERVVNICKGFIKEKLNISWVASSRTDLFSKISDKLLFELKPSGLQRLIVGAESGSQDALNIMNKKTKSIDNIMCAQKVKKAAINATYTFITGFPGYSINGKPLDLKDTINSIIKIRKIHRNIFSKIFYFAPYPGTPLFEKSLEVGMKKPNSLEEWTQYNPLKIKSPWISNKYKIKIKMIIRYYLIYGYPSDTIIHSFRKKGFFYSLMLKLFSPYAKIRIITGCYFLPIDWYLFRLIKKDISTLNEYN